MTRVVSSTRVLIEPFHALPNVCTALLFILQKECGQYMLKNYKHNDPKWWNAVKTQTTFKLCKTVSPTKAGLTNIAPLHFHHILPSAPSHHWHKQILSLDWPKDAKPDTLHIWHCIEKQWWGGNWVEFPAFSWKVSFGVRLQRAERAERASFTIRADLLSLLKLFPTQ